MGTLVLEPIPGNEKRNRVKSINGVNLNTGLYRVYWVSGGWSLVAIGVCRNGDWWIAPTNWVKPAAPLRLRNHNGRTGWDDIARLEKIADRSTFEE